MKKTPLLLLCLLAVSTVSMANIKLSAAGDEGKAIAADILNNDITPSVSSSSGQTTMKSMGVASQTVGSPSSDQVNDMGIAGKRIGSFSFSVRPACHYGSQHAWGLDGVILTISCQGHTAGNVNVALCFPNKVNIHNKGKEKKCKRIDTIVLPINGSAISKDQYTWTSSCNKEGHCRGSMTTTEKSVVASNDDMTKKGQQAIQNNQSYNTVYNIYATKEGYSKTSAYMKSFQNNGKNNWLSQCVAGTKGVIQGGTYRSCDGKQAGQFYSSCKATKSCKHYQRKEKKVVTHPTCKLSPESKHITCQQTTEVSVVTQSYYENNTYHGSLSLDNYTSGHLSSPSDGKITAFSINFSSSRDAWWCQYNYHGYLQSTYLSTYNIGCGFGLGGLAFSNNNLAILVRQGQKIQFHTENATTWYGSGVGASYSLTMRILKHKKVATTKQVQTCPSGVKSHA